MFVSLEQSHQENTIMTRMVAHDLKNPVWGIQSLARSLLKRKEYAEEVKQSLELIANASSNSLTLINDLLNDSETSKSFSKEMVDMQKLLHYCILLLQTKADEKKQHIAIESEYVFISINRQKIWRVISNIVSNAIKFSPGGSSINVHLENKENTVLLTVKDNGIGIPPELKDKIFFNDPGVSRAGTAGEESHALGLVITRMIVQEHNGKIWFESEEGKGSIFYVELPRVTEEGETFADAEQTEMRNTG